MALEDLVAHQAANHKVAQALPDQHFLDSEVESNILVKFSSIKHSPKNKIFAFDFSSSSAMCCSLQLVGEVLRQG